MQESEYKKDIIRRINEARKNGIGFGKLEKECPEDIGIRVLVGMLNAYRFPMETWKSVDESLKKLGY